MGLIGLAYLCKAKKPEEVDAGMVEAWRSRLNANEVTSQEFALRCGQVGDKSGFYPSLGEFMKPILDSRPSFAAIPDAVNCEGGIVASRRAALKSQLPILEQKPCNELSGKSYDDIVKGLEFKSLEVKENPQAKYELMRTQVEDTRGSL